MKLKHLTIVLTGVALLAGGAASFGAKNYIDKTVAQFKASLEQQYEKVKVAVAARDLPAGASLDSRTVVSREVPKAYLHKDAIKVEQWKRFTGRTSRANLTGGAPILTSQLIDPNTSELAETLSPGKRALTVPVDQISSISGLLSPGDRIDMLLTLDNGKGEQTFPLMKDVLVIATGVDTGAEQPVVNRRTQNLRPRGFNTVTIVVEPEQAAKIVHAREVGSITVVLRAEDDPSDGWPDRVTLASLLGTPEVVRKPRKITPKVQIILGGQTRP